MAQLFLELLKIEHRSAREKDRLVKYLIDITKNSQKQNELLIYLIDKGQLSPFIKGMVSKVSGEAYRDFVVMQSVSVEDDSELTNSVSR